MKFIRFVLENDFWTRRPTPSINFVHAAILTIFNKISLNIGWIKTLSGPSAVARTGYRAERCDLDALGGLAPLLCKARGAGAAAA